MSDQAFDWDTYCLSHLLETPRGDPTYARRRVESALEKEDEVLEEIDEGSRRGQCLDEHLQKPVVVERMGLKLKHGLTAEAS